MGFYDVKHAKLCAVFAGEGLTHREPAVDELDFERYVKSLSPLMLPERDVLWVLGGRTDTHDRRIKRILARNFISAKAFHLSYNTKQMMQFGHFKKQRGIANSRSHELLYLCYKNRVPKQLSKLRVHVDAGSAGFNQLVRSVAGVPAQSHALVAR